MKEKRKIMNMKKGIVGKMEKRILEKNGKK